MVDHEHGKEWNQTRQVTKEDECLTGLTGEDRQIAEEVAAEIKAQATKALQENEQGVLDTFDELFAADGLAAKEEYDRLEKARKLREMLTCGDESEKAAVRRLLQNEQRAEVIDLDSMPLETVKSQTRKRASMHQKVHQNRQADRRAARFGFRGFGGYAVDKLAARGLFEQRTEVKPRWAVQALVLLRDAGVCRVCKGQVFSDGGEVKQLVLNKLGGQYSEINCVLVCKDCAKAWPAKDFFITSAVEFHFWELCMLTLKRRMAGRNGSRPLNEKGLIRMDEIRRRVASAIVEFGRVVDKVKEQETLNKVPSALVV